MSKDEGTQDDQNKTMEDETNKEGRMEKKTVTRRPTR